MEVGSAPPGTAAEKQENVKLLENKQAANDRAKGADVFQFDPKASPEEKAAQAKKVRQFFDLLLDTTLYCF